MTRRLILSLEKWKSRFYSFSAEFFRTKIREFDWLLLLLFLNSYIRKYLPLTYMKKLNIEMTHSKIVKLSSLEKMIKFIRNVKISRNRTNEDNKTKLYLNIWIKSVEIQIRFAYESKIFSIYFNFEQKISTFCLSQYAAISTSPQIFMRAPSWSALIKKWRKKCIRWLTLAFYTLC